jgi:hypothetical protein
MVEIRRQSRLAMHGYSVHGLFGLRQKASVHNKRKAEADGKRWKAPRAAAKFLSNRVQEH